MNKLNDILEYISIYCTAYKTDLEKKAYEHYVAQMKFTPFKDYDTNFGKKYHEWTSSDPKVLKLLENGIQNFHQTWAQRVYEEHGDKLNLPLCPKCQGILRTPSAKQCRYCSFNWR